jgi:hypothetical protein
VRTNPFESQLERLARTLTEQFGVTVLCQGDCPCPNSFARRLSPILSLGKHSPRRSMG